MEGGAVFVEGGAERKREVRRGTRVANSEEIHRAIKESTRVAIFPDGWKLCLRDAEKHELYNLQSDPGEKQNLYHRGGPRNLIRRLTREIHRWQEDVEDSVKV